MVRINIPSPDASSRNMGDRSRNLQVAAADRQAVFRGDCATCHVTPTVGKTGKALFDSACGICHEGPTRASMVPDLRALTKPTDHAYWTQWITSGREGSLMPAFALNKQRHSTDDQIKSLADYLDGEFRLEINLPGGLHAGPPGGSGTAHRGTQALNRMVRGRLITFEGGEAGGKSTQIRLLSERLRRRAGWCANCANPVAHLGERSAICSNTDPDGHGMAAETELLLMNASRAELVRRTIRPALAAGEMVLCDRFYDSTTAYQAGGRGLDASAVRSVIDFAVGDTRPDLTLWLRVPRAMALQRLAQRSAVGAPPGRSFRSGEGSVL
jgi:dTMP kinase